MYTAILFDLDNTLIDRGAALRSLIRATFGPSPVVLNELVELDEGGYGDRQRFSTRWHELGGGKLEPARFGLAISRFIKKQHDLLRSLRKLTESTKLAIVSNGGVATQQSKWRAAGLDTVVPQDRLLISEAVGLRKPDPAIFHLACNLLCAEPRDCLFVGDQPLQDIRGAKAAGLSAILATSPLKPRDVLSLPTLLKSSAGCGL